MKKNYEKKTSGTMGIIPKVKELLLIDYKITFKLILSRWSFSVRRV
tara:strand:+ start:591 stop:728 length:138 start_codon:yes stop_codon:yes gene_type:complete